MRESRLRRVISGAATTTVTADPRVVPARKAEFIVSVVIGGGF
jgi:hypothetical protein